MTFTWDAPSGRYLLTTDGRPDVAVGGARVGAATVVLQEVPAAQREPRRQRRPTPVVDGVGHGPVTVFRDGQLWRGEWSRPDLGSPTGYTTGGQPHPSGRRAGVGAAGALRAGHRGRLTRVLTRPSLGTRRPRSVSPGQPRCRGGHPPKAARGGAGARYGEPACHRAFCGKGATDVQSDQGHRRQPHGAPSHVRRAVRHGRRAGRADTRRPRQRLDRGRLDVPLSVRRATPTAGRWTSASRGARWARPCREAAAGEPVHPRGAARHAELHLQQPPGHHRPAGPVGGDTRASSTRRWWSSSATWSASTTTSPSGATSRPG